MRIETRFPGDLRIDAEVRGHRIRTDQPERYGGGDTAPAPFEHFLASIATCAGLYAVQFCRQRQLPVAGLAVALEAERNQESGELAELRLEVVPPEGFPEKYLAALRRAVDQCAVKKVLEHPPRTSTRVLEPATVS
jgi:putative redox protein